MTFLAQEQSKATNSWPVIGKHLGLLEEDKIRYIPAGRIRKQFTCRNSNCDNKGAIYTYEPESMIAVNSYDCAWCGWCLERKIIEPAKLARLPFDQNGWQKRRVYQDELNELRHGKQDINFISPIQNWLSCIKGDLGNLLNEIHSIL